MTKYYGFRGDFRVAMVQLDSALVASGWTRYAGGIPSMLTGYYDRHYGPDRPKPADFPRQYLVQNIPGVSYTRDAFRLMIRSQEADSTGKAFVLRFEDIMAMPHEVAGRGLTAAASDALSHQEEHAVDTDSLLPVILETNRLRAGDRDPARGLLRQLGRRREARGERRLHKLAAQKLPARPDAGDTRIAEGLAHQAAGSDRGPLRGLAVAGARQLVHAASPAMSEDPPHHLGGFGAFCLSWREAGTSLAP